MVFRRRGGKRRVQEVIINPTEEQVMKSISVVIEEDDAGTVLDDSSIFARDDDDNASRRTFNSSNHLTSLVSASLQDIGKVHSSMDVHGCLSSTCNFCGTQDSISFVPRDSSDVDLLRKTMWAICEAEQCVPIPSAKPKCKEDHAFRCTCGQEACGNFYEI